MIVVDELFPGLAGDFHPFYPAQAGLDRKLVILDYASLTLYRLGLDGSPDPGFESSVLSVSGTSYERTIGLDGAVYVGTEEGATINGVPFSGVVARFGTDGEFDPSFVPDGASFASVRAVSGGATGDLYVAGRDGGDNDIVIKFNSAGAVDAGFSYDNSDSLVFPTSMCEAADGKVVIVSDYAAKRCNTNGSIDGSFVSPTILDSPITIAHPGCDGSIFVLSVSNSGGIALTKYNPDGTISSAYNAAAASTLSAFSGHNIANFVGHRANGKVLLVLGGTYPSTNTQYILQLNSDGTEDEAFSSPLTTSVGTTMDLGCVLDDASESVILIGSATSFQLDGTPYSANRMTRLYLGSPEPEPPATCFWTDLVGVSQDCGEAPDPEVSWAPIHTSDAYHSLSAASEGTSMSASTITTDIGFGDANWTLYLGTPAPPGGRVRVTVNITSATGDGGNLAFYYTQGESYDYDGAVFNEHSDATTFAPSQFVVETLNRGDQHYLTLNAFGVTGLNATYFIEVESAP